MVTHTVSCPHCQSENLIRHGATADGRQRHKCLDCGRRSRQDARPNGYTEEERATILRAYRERSSLRGLTRTFGVARNTVAAWLKRKPARSRRSPTR